MTSPPSPQEKQWYSSLPGVTLNDGVRSSWNGHSPLSEPPPALPQLEVLAHHVRDGRSLTNCRDVFLANATRHEASL